MPTWPASLPQTPLAEGFKETAKNLQLRTTMDAGPAKTRRRFTAGVRPFSFRMIMTAAQVVTFDDFYESTLDGGVDTFTWDHPRTGSESTFRIVRPPSYISAGFEVYSVLIDMEEMPS